MRNIIWTYRVRDSEIRDKVVTANLRSWHFVLKWFCTFNFTHTAHQNINNIDVSCMHLVQPLRVKDSIYTIREWMIWSYFYTNNELLVRAVLSILIGIEFRMIDDVKCHWLTSATVACGGVATKGGNMFLFRRTANKILAFYFTNICPTKSSRIEHINGINSNGSSS